MALYFLAILPPEAIREEIKLLKMEVAEKFGARHALKLPAHITLQSPFKLEESDELSLQEILKIFAEGQAAFDVKLKDFGSFPPRVIFVDVENKEPVIRLFEELQKTLITNRLIGEINDKFHPHLTVATRDLDRNLFKKAWYLFKQRKYASSFAAKNVSVMKHNGKIWEIHEEFQFQK